MFLKISFAAAVVFLVGCASTIAPGNKARLAPPNAAKTTVYIFDSIEGVGLVVNNVKSGALGRHSYTWFQVPAGTIDISLNDPLQTSRKLTARRLETKPGDLLFLQYDIGSQGSDGALIFEALSGASKGRVNFKPEDLPTIDEKKAGLLMEKYELVGNLIE